jgi:type II secretory pathway pseudopilin PulG
MAVLLVALSVMAVLATAVMPVWKTLSQREKEAELIFRGEQYVRAIRLFSRRAGPGVLPPNVDVLVQQRFLRKKYKDPITGDDFDLLSPLQGGAGSATPGTLPGSTAGASPYPGRGGAPQQGSIVSASTAPGPGGGPTAGGIMGVASKSKESSIRLYNGRSHYNEWQFLYVQQVQQPGAGAPGQRGRGDAGRGGQGPQPMGAPGIGRPGGAGQPRGFPPPGGPPGRFGPPGGPAGGPQRPPQR